jgi:hypothetical protein
MIYLIIALALEVAVLPQFSMLAPRRFNNIFDLRLLALAGILIGLSRGEIRGMLTASAAACLFGFSQPPGVLGASLVSFSLVAFLAGLLARRLRLQSPLTRWFVISLLLVLERLIWCITRQIYWPETMIDVPRLAIILTAVIGALLYRPLAPKLRLKPMRTK